MSAGKPKAASADYDTNPERFRVGSESASRYGPGDVHGQIAARFARERVSPVLDVGCGEGRLIHALNENGIDTVGLDTSVTMLNAMVGRRLLADASSLPIGDGSIPGVAALYMLYHLEEPELALAEAKRVLRKGGLFVTAVPSRYTDPEFAAVLPQERATFDAEIAPGFVARFFTDIHVEAWDGPLISLPDRPAVARYLFGRGLDKSSSESVARRTDVPLTVTKRGCVVWGRRDG